MLSEEERGQQADTQGQGEQQNEQSPANKMIDKAQESRTGEGKPDAVDKVIDKAQESGMVDKAVDKLKEKFGGR